MNKIDLHIHTTASDGRYTPSQIVDMALKKKIPVIAITDHDLTTGVKEAINYAKDKPVKVIPGIEITITPPKDCKELHIVGLFINPEDKGIKKIPGRHKRFTEEFVKKIIRKLNVLGYNISFEEVLKETNGNSFGRPTVAKILIDKYPEEFKDRKDVFNKLLGKKGKVFVRPRGTEMKKAIEIIHNAGGIAIIAHPYFLGENMEEIIGKFVKSGGEGIEKDFIKRDSIPDNMAKRIEKMIKKYNLLVSGGTDFHENNEKGMEIGDSGVTQREFEFLERFLKNKISRV